MTPTEGWRRLTEALAARQAAPPLLPEQPWQPPAFGALLQSLMADRGLPTALRIAAAVMGDEPASEGEVAPPDLVTAAWQAVALRRAARFPEARRCFRELGDLPIYPALYPEALTVLAATGPGFRWAYTARSLLTARGTWDPLWFVDSCAAVHSGLLSRESGALLEEIQRAELRLLLEVGAG